jgi:nitrate reductase alpha subunit
MLTASPQVWGEQTDVHESADWYDSMYIIVWGANIAMTRTPDAHFLSEVRYRGAKVVVITSDYTDVTKFADLWIPPKPGTDTAFRWSLDKYMQMSPHYNDISGDALMNRLEEMDYQGFRILIH